MNETANPFVLYRTRLLSFEKAWDLGMSDPDFTALIEDLDSAVSTVSGTGFTVTPLVRAPGLAATCQVDTDRIWVKDETGNVGGSHKGRHLFGVLLHLALAEAKGELAIASCGNAAVAAAILAKAVERDLRVFIPTWADSGVVHELERHDAHIQVCERLPGETGDPAYLRFTEAVGAGSIPFSVQSTMTPFAVDGGRTIGWELASQLMEAGATGTVRLFVQIGGGALASAVWAGLLEGLEGAAEIDPVLHAVQVEACAPLVRAWDMLTTDVAELNEAKLPQRRPARARKLRKLGLVDEAVDIMAARPDSLMWPWEVVGTSAASGILDDVAYDWQAVVEAMLRSGGWPVVVNEKKIDRAHRAAHTVTGINVSATGSAGLAALFDSTTTEAVSSNDTIVLLFSGVER